MSSQLIVAVCQGLHGWLSLRRRNYGHAVLSQTRRQGLLPRYLVCDAQLWQRDWRRDQLLHELVQVLRRRSGLGNIPDLCWIRMFGSHMGTAAVQDCEGTTPGRQQGLHRPEAYMEAGVQCLGSLLEADQSMLANIDNRCSTDATTDLARVPSSLQFVLLWRDHGHLPVLAFLRPCTRSVFAPRP
jgi:hypothetical protein